MPNNIRSQRGTSKSRWRVALQKLVPEEDSSLVNNRWRPILTVEEEPTPGRYDMLIAASDGHRDKGLPGMDRV